MYTRGLQVLLIVGLVASLAGCWNATRQYNKFMALGQQRHVPLVIYNTTWDKPAVHANVLGVAFVNTGNVPITALTLDLGACSPMGDVRHTFRLDLPGPFAPGRSYVIPHAAHNYEYDATHLVIQEVDVGGVAGNSTAYRGNVAQLLAPTVSNYCPDEQEIGARAGS